MADPERVVVVGGGLAAATCCGTLVEQGFDGSVTVVAAEDHLPYERPPLSKGYLLGSAEIDSVVVHPRSWYDEHGVELRLGSPATAIDLAGRSVTVDGRDLGYDRLLLATGAAPRRLPLADDSVAPVTYLRTIADSRRIKAALTPGRTLAVVGAGWIGLEVAAAARTAGCDTVVVETAAQPLQRVLGPELGAVFASLHRAHGVDLRTEVGLTSLRAAGDRAVLGLDDGSTVTADLVLVGVGVVPETALATSAGLSVDDGVVVDELLRASAPGVFAAGDLAAAFHPRLGRRVRVEHWDNAIAQGRAAAHSMLGAGTPYDRLPYFFTDQYDLGMEYVGHVGPGGYDEVVVRGEPADGPFTAFWLGQGRVLAGMQVNDWDATDAIRRVLDAGTVDLPRLRDPRVPLAEVVP
ncbi:MAG: FAD-dependent oxidoreductase [Nocardioidaceae bacterium]